MTLLLALALVSAGAGLPVGQSCSRAAYLLLNRHLDRSWLDSAETLLARIRQAEPSNESCLVLLARLRLTGGDAAQDRAAKQRLYQSARAFADTLRRLNDQNPDGHMWWATAQGRIGQLKGIASAAFMADDIRREYFRTLELDPGRALAHYALGTMYRMIPGLLGGSLSKAEEYLKRAAELDPHYTIIRLGLARLRLQQGRSVEARSQLELVLAEATPTHPAECQLEDKPEARALLLRLVPSD